MPMPNRQIVGGQPYRYAYQGQEIDPETGKEAFQLRLWDSRIGRWLTTDPKGQYDSPYVGMGNDPINGIDSDGGWKTKWSQFFAWVGNGFKGTRFTSDTGTGNNKFGIDIGGEGEIDMIFTDNGLTRSNLDAWDTDILNRSSGGIEMFSKTNWSLRTKIDKVRLKDWRGAMSEVAREKIGGPIRAGAEYGLMGSGLYGGNISKVAPGVVRKVNAVVASVDDIIIRQIVISNSNINTYKRQVSRLIMSQISPHLSFKQKRKVIEFMQKEHIVISTDNINMVIDKLGYKKVRGGI
jgi:RHS repeat-associated protein